MPIGSREPKARVLAMITAAVCLSSTTLEATGLEEGIKELATQILSTMKSSDTKKIAVVEFTDLNGRESVLGQFIAEELVTQMFMVAPGQFDVVERSQLKKIMAEQKLGSTGLFDPETIAAVGKMLGIQAIVTGSIADLGTDVRINARLIAMDTAKVFAAAAAKVPKQGPIEELLRQAGLQPAYGPPVGGGKEAGRQQQRPDVYFQNKDLRVEVQSIGLSKDKEPIALHRSDPEPLRRKPRAARRAR